MRNDATRIKRSFEVCAGCDGLRYREGEGRVLLCGLRCMRDTVQFKDSPFGGLHHRTRDRLVRTLESWGVPDACKDERYETMRKLRDL